MSARLGSLLVVVASMTAYHVAQRSMPGGLRPASVFAFVYGAATLLMVVLVASGLAAGEAGDVVDSGRHWAPWVLVAAVSGIELGVLAMYRAGWGIGSASISAQALTAAILVLVGLGAFGEHLTLARGTGLLLCASGAALLVHR